MILTGTPDGLVGVRDGDDVVTEIDGIGSLSNTIVGESPITYASGSRSG